MASLSNPNVLQLHMVGESDGVGFLAMEYVGGGILAQRLDGSAWHPSDAAIFIQKLARAVHAVHEKGILHRAICPAHIFLTDDGQPKLAGIGLVTLISGTNNGSLFGEIPYLPPERVVGLPGPRSITEDIYSVGVIFYELLTGRRPFEGASTAETVAQILKQKPTAPRQLQPHIPGELEAICLRCLEKQVSERYPSAQALSDDFDRFLSCNTAAAEKAGMLRHALRWVFCRQASE